MDYAPYAWRPAAVSAFRHYIDEGRGGWIGFHHASLLGEFDGYPMWQWFSNFMGNIRWKDVSAYNDSYTHWPWFVRFLGGAVFKDNSWPPMPARLLVDDTLHPVTLGLPGKYAGPVKNAILWLTSPAIP